METLDAKYIDEKRVAEITGIALSTLRNDRFHHRGIPYVKIRRSVRYDIRDVLKYMEAHKILTIDFPTTSKTVKRPPEKLEIRLENIPDRQKRRA